MELLLAIGGYLINFSPFWVIVVLIILLIITTINSLPRLRRAIQHKSFRELQVSSVGHESPLSHEIVKSFTFYAQMVNALIGENIVQKLLPASQQTHGFTRLKCLSPTLFSTFFGRYLLDWLLPFLAFFIALACGLFEWLFQNYRQIKCRCCRRVRRSCDSRKEEEQSHDFSNEDQTPSDTEPLLEPNTHESASPSLHRRDSETLRTRLHVLLLSHIL